MKSNKTKQLRAIKTKPIKILIFTPVWKRKEIFKICLNGIKRLVDYDPSRFEIQPFFMVSEGWAAREIMKFGYDFIFIENRTLGSKKNAGLMYALENFDFDYLLEIGSDDLLTCNYLDEIEGLLKSNVLQFCPDSVYFVESRTGETSFAKTDMVLGLGRFISRAAIETVTRHESFWEPEGNRGMDTYSWKKLAQFGISNHIFETNAVVFGLDIKSEINIHRLSAFNPSPKSIDEILKHFPESPQILKLINKKQIPELVEG